MLAVFAPVNYRSGAAAPRVATGVYAKKAGTATYVIALALDTWEPIVR